MNSTDDVGDVAVTNMINARILLATSDSFQFKISETVGRARHAVIYRTFIRKSRKNGGNYA